MTNVKSPEIVIHLCRLESGPHNANVCIATHARRSCQIMRLYELYNNKFKRYNRYIGRRVTTVDKNNMITTRYRVHVSCVH